MTLPTISETEDERRAAASSARMQEAGYEDSISGLFKALKSDDLSTRIEAAFLLGKSKDETARTELDAALNDDSARVRVEAALALARLGDDTRAKPILEQELDGQFFIDAPLRAARALAMLGNPSGYSRVVEALKSPMPSNRMEAIAVLPAFVPFEGEHTANGATVEVVDSLIGAAGDDEPILRRDALTTLAAFDDSHARASIEAAVNDPDQGVRDLARSLLESN